VTFTELERSIPSPPPRVRPLQPEPPLWVRELFNVDAHPVSSVERRGALQVVRRDPVARVTARIPNAAALSAADLSDCVEFEYRAIAGVLSDVGYRPVRFWNYIPGIVDAVGAGVDRYMAFNRGRFRAYAAMPTVVDNFDRVLPAASAVGISGADLVIECLASTTGGAPVENPRQIAPWQYSRRYGPKPPCFARGTLTRVDERRVLLIGGTASIVGEESRHPGDLTAQVGELLINLKTLIAAAAGTDRQALERLVDVRIYIVNAEDADAVEAALHAVCGAETRTETVLARVCREELLVEVEGVARMPEDR
jgi:chorismate lyase / 3-hydroxybenzoate synthase